MKPLSYEQHFERRGNTYDRAMRAYPLARAEEFAQVINAVPVQAGMTVADVPAGGGYLRGFLPPGCHWLGHEPCAAFGHQAARAAESKPLLPLPWGSASVDVALSLAGVHHLADKRPLYTELLRVVRPGGHLVLSDVERDSAVANFLDGFVGAHNDTGHEGIYLDEETPRQLQAAGWDVLSNAHRDFHWVFTDHAALGAFCQQLFGLRSVTPAQVLTAVVEHLGVSRRADGGIGMHWALRTLVARKA